MTGLAATWFAPGRRTGVDAVVIVSTDGLPIARARAASDADAVAALAATASPACRSARRRPDAGSGCGRVRSSNFRAGARHHRRPWHSGARPSSCSRAPDADLGGLLY